MRPTVEGVGVRHGTDDVAAAGVQHAETVQQVDEGGVTVVGEPLPDLLSHSTQLVQFMEDSYPEMWEAVAAGPGEGDDAAARPQAFDAVGARGCRTCSATPPSSSSSWRTATRRCGRPSPPGRGRGTTP
ncbi:hypothetical protein, partial [Corynebacterium bovis]|uniref:hypothetical protein n=1 Tax=Corynebacterium bovis TaxID=36808 RepID=UPI003138BE01